MLSDLLRPLSSDLADTFDDVPTPRPIGDQGTAHITISIGSWEPPALGDASKRIVILAGSAAITEAWALHSLASHLGAPVANTWGAKGIYPWDNPHHMGTCGLQRDDFALLGFADFDLILAVGVDDDETSKADFALAETISLGVNRERFERIRALNERRTFVPQANQLYARMAAIAQPGYVDDSYPRHPARAVMDLKQSLGPATRVTAQPGLAGLWIARTFPTNRMGSVIVPAQDRPGIGAAVGMASAAHGTDTVCVTHGAVDDTTAEVMNVAHHHALPLRLEVWDDDVDWTRTDDLIDAAGPVVAWT